MNVFTFRKALEAKVKNIWRLFDFVLQPNFQQYSYFYIRLNMYFCFFFRFAYFANTQWTKTPDGSFGPKSPNTICCHWSNSTRSSSIQMCRRKRCWRKKWLGWALSRVSPQTECHASWASWKDCGSAWRLVELSHRSHRICLFFFVW